MLPKIARLHLQMDSYDEQEAWSYSRAHAAVEATLQAVAGPYFG